MKMLPDNRKPIDKNQRASLLKKTKNRCACCGCDIEDDSCHIDHIIPFSWVGDQLYSNYQPLCDDCNWMKSDDPLFMIKYYAINGKMVNYLSDLKKLYQSLSEGKYP